jgi:hypothetical protein
MAEEDRRGSTKGGTPIDSIRGVSVFHLAYLKSVEFFHPGVFVELVRLNYGLDYDKHG